MILDCFRCANDQGKGAAYQDERYGKGRRVHNETPKRLGGKLIYRCSICTTERTSGESPHAQFLSSVSK